VLKDQRECLLGRRFKPFNDQLERWFGPISLTILYDASPPSLQRIGAHHT
jgi:hypothetical protein